MKMTTTTSTPQTIKSPNRTADSTTASRVSSFENDLTNKVLQEGNGRGLLKFCRELAVILIQRYSVDDDAARLRDRLRASLLATLKCSESQAECLINLSLEMIHHKTHGEYRRSDLELSYLVAQASGIVSDVSVN